MTLETAITISSLSIAVIAIMLSWQSNRQAGVATMALSNQYSLTLTFLDERKPYFVVKGTLISGEEKTVVLENTLYLEPDKPALLGVTNLRDALILVVRRLEDTPPSSASSPPEPAAPAVRK